MKKLKVNLKNCFGISKLEKEFNFENDNIVTIYARNGLMKTSFAKVFKKLQMGKCKEIKDEIFNIEGKAVITSDGENIGSDEIFVIKSYENFYESSNIAALLVNEEIKEKIKDVLNLKIRFLKKLEGYSGLKIQKKSKGETIYELEPQIVKDFDFDEDSFLLNIPKLSKREVIYNCSNVKYTEVFNDDVVKKICSEIFQEKIEDFISESNKIYQEYDFLEKGKFTLDKLKNIQKTLEKDAFFIKGNKILLEGEIEIRNIEDFEKQVEDIEKKIKAVPTLNEIEKLLGNVKGKVLKDIIELNPDIINYLKKDKLNQLKRDMWISYIKEVKNEFNELLSKYKELEKEIEDVKFKDSQWEKSLEIFKKRFDVPYEMEITNLKGSIIGESIPRIEFSFEKNGKKVNMNRGKLESCDVLSQGERRSLYLLNIIFDIQQRKKMNKKTLFVVDDIADSFDYKNKYAIVEYLWEIGQNENFYMIILSHNFDFYRTISSRMNVNRDNRFFAELKGEKINIREEKYQKQPFIVWKKNLLLKNVLALIPFMRNIIEYGNECNCGKVEGVEDDFLLLTNLLHEKDKTKLITFKDLKVLFSRYLGCSDYKNDINELDAIVDKIYTESDKVEGNNNDLEYKIILAMAIRHRAETFMIEAIKTCGKEIMVKKKKELIMGNKFIETLGNEKNQTRALYNAYKQIGEIEKIRILDEVNIMTPENIHVNSFMYEPLLDMDIFELINLNKVVKEKLVI